MMKLLLAVIATCALVVSPTCIKIKHQLRSNAPTIHVLISNGNTQMTSQVGRNGSHRFITDNLSSMTLAPAGSQTITLSYDQIFPITDAAVCTEVHPLSAGGCADGVCCKISISMYTITDAIIMTARVNNRKADGNPQFWKCEQEIQVPGVTNTELSPEELVTDILHGEAPGNDCSNDDVCKNNNEDLHLKCSVNHKCECVTGYAPDADNKCERVAHGVDCYEDVECGDSAVDSAVTLLKCGASHKCVCVSGYILVGDKCRKKCTNDDECHINAVCENVDTDEACVVDCNKVCNCKTNYYGDGTVCAEDDVTDTGYCHPINSYCRVIDSVSPKGACAPGFKMYRYMDYTDGNERICIDIDECTSGTHTCTTQTDSDGNSIATCHNTVGNYTCSCKSEYYGDGYTDGTECTACGDCTATQYCEAYNDAEKTCCTSTGCKDCDCGTNHEPCQSGDCNCYISSHCGDGWTCQGNTCQAASGGKS